MGGLQIIIMILLSCFGNILETRAQTTSTLEKEEGKPVELDCLLTGIFTFPEWLGPPSLLKYTFQDDNSGQINSAAPAANRLSVAINNQSLAFSKVYVNDSGEYKCIYTGLGDHTIILNVTETTTTTPPSNNKGGIIGSTVGSLAGVTVIVVVVVVIWKKKNSIIFNVKNPVVYTAGERIKVICSLKKKVPEAVMHWYDKDGVEITATNGLPSVKDLDDGKKLLDLGEATEDKAGTYKSTATMTDNPEHVAYKKTLDINFREKQQQSKTERGESKKDSQKKKKVDTQNRTPRPQPTPPVKPLENREESGSAVSREDVDLQDHSNKLHKRPMPNIPRSKDKDLDFHYNGHDNKGHGLSANFDDNFHPMTTVGIPEKKAGALEPLDEAAGEQAPKKLKKKKKKRLEDDDQF